jgi:glutamine amidotransferase
MIAIVDYNIGNLESVRHALRSVGADARVTAKPEDLRTAERIVLPGVGAFGRCMTNLRESEGILDALREEVREKGKPLLGICVGMQMLATRGEEDGSHEGLGWISGDVRRLEVDRTHGLNVPHMGWNALQVERSNGLFDGIGSSATFYFVHSYHFVPNDRSDVAATSEHGEQFVSALVRDNVFATQFHPEKSQHDGLQLLANWVAWRP